ncbi:hypothetical protein V6N11_052803 [Hibiscus sabdariffa]|uniref:Uncharacterized protein n=1 Tax=Hibiscus sabdariffa TaxID=183260 RepID=A0ABR2UBE8_9ROSI
MVSLEGESRCIEFQSFLPQDVLLHIAAIKCPLPMLVMRLLCLVGQLTAQIVGAFSKSVGVHLVIEAELWETFIGLLSTWSSGHRRQVVWRRLDF